MKFQVLQAFQDIIEGQLIKRLSGEVITVSKLTPFYTSRLKHGDIAVLKEQKNEVKKKEKAEEVN